ncbi:hypothetical protein [Janibacter sp. YB324]|uniref:hypothetical protein n=1 Tax=Janibacter sp. YB324 TaxID=2761047 RepID=UPI0016259FFB|nr:hypothetical protein [Janibacter sp. YB324]QNF94435.1 hypothetical protein H7A72_00915 [Janibacter sp. YB324]
MRPLPQHWQRASTEVEHEGRRFPLRIWGWSVESAADAAVRARHRLSVAVEQLTRGRQGFDYYPRSPLREEVLHEVRADDGTLLGVVTRNRMGVDVLNTDEVLVADVDLPAPRRKLFRTVEPDPGPALERIARWAAAHPDLGVRTYRTAAGLRVIITGLPSGPPDLEVLVALGSDDLYVRLCGLHETSRARLTPKPYRVGLPRIPVGWPYVDGMDRVAENWLSRYTRACSGHAVCELLSVTGPLPDRAPGALVDLHDRVTLASSGLPLA